MTNNKRADVVIKPLVIFAQSVGMKFDGVSNDGDGPEYIVSDFLADLRHYCKREGISWSAVTKRSAMHYNAEKFGYED